MCGAADGAYDSFLDENLLLCFSEPMDHRFPVHLGFQIICFACSVGSITVRLPLPIRVRRSYIARWPKYCLSFSVIVK
jgi:hypothetical protein